MEKRNFIIPEFGPLAGLRVIGAGSLMRIRPDDVPFVRLPKTNNSVN